LLGPDQHPLAALLGKPNCARDDINGQGGGKFRDSAEPALRYQSVDDLLRLGGERLDLRVLARRLPGGLGDLLLASQGSSPSEMGASILKRIANDPAANNYNSSYNAGIYVYSPDASQLYQAFTKIASEVLRVSK